MNDRLSRFFLPSVLVTGGLIAVCAAAIRPAYFSSFEGLATLLFLQVLLASVWNYRVCFFSLLLVVFLWAGMVVPLSAVWTSGRWLVLALGALAGLIVYARDRRYQFTTFHLVALFCVMAALLSAAISAYPRMAFLKAMSLLLLFLYGSLGARLAVAGREASFLSWLVMGCELLVYITAISYFIFQSAIFGNPNSLGAVMGVAATPVLVWGILVSEWPTTRWRRTFAFALALLQTAIPLWGAARRDVVLMSAAGPAALAGFGFVAFAFLSLVAVHVQSDFSVASVYANSHSAQPLR